MVSRGQHLIGKVLGSYQLESLLGYGGSSAVFLAQQRHSPERKVAVKVFLPRPLMDVHMQREFYRRFLHEAEVASKLEHSNILPILSYGEQDGLPYLAMPYMSGGTLAEYLSLHGPLSLQEALWYLEQIASALDYAHEHGCVHCDIKPANILLDSEGYALLSDFGIARVAHTAEDTLEQPAAKVREAVVGTPDYISPEQALGRPVDGRSDIYSLGILLFYMLTRRLPFRADSPIALALLHVHESPPSLMSIRTDVTYEIDQVILKALAKKPEERFQTAQQFCSALAKAITLSTDHNASVAPQIMQPIIYRPPERRGALTAWQILAGNMPRLVIIGTLLLLLISGSSIVYAKYIVSYFGGSKVSHVSATAVASTQKNSKTPIDYLADYNAWPVSSTFFYDAQHQSYYILNNSTSGVALAPYSGHLFSNFRLSVTMDFIRGKSTDYYGVAFRCSADQARYYLFEIDNDGSQYDFWLQDNGHWQNLAIGHSPVQNNKAGQSNTITVEAQKNVFTFQINGKQVGTSVAVPAKFLMTAGQVGLYVEDQGTEVAFSHLYIDAL